MRQTRGCDEAEGGGTETRPRGCRVGRNRTAGLEANGGETLALGIDIYGPALVTLLDWARA